MIDTIKFLIPADLATISRVKAKSERTTREDLSSRQIAFEYHLASVVVGSHSHKIIINPKESYDGLFVEFSIPKYKFGNNVEMIRPDEVTDALNLFKAELENYFEIVLPPLSSWEIFRLDFCYNWTFDTKQQAELSLDFIKKINVPRKKKIPYDTTVYFKGSSYVIRFYLKGPEFMKNSRKHMLDKIGIEETSFFSEWSSKVLRFEVECKKKHLQYLFKQERIYFNQELIDNAQSFLSSYLDRVFMYIPRNEMETENILQYISKHFKPKRALTLYNFYKAYFCNDETKILLEQGALERTTIYKYRKDLNRLGITYKIDQIKPELLDLGILTIPSKQALFTLLDYKKNI
jgi:hypothetical protein